MNVTVKTPFAQIDLEMSEHHAKELLRIAFDYSSLDTMPITPAETASDPTPATAPVEIAPREPAPAPAPAADKPKSRTERMFGDRSTWNTPQESYVGFLYVECEKCGKRKAFHAKYPATFHKCDCGHHTTLKNLRPMSVRCKCGASYKYKTNVRDDLFQMKCYTCGNSVDMQRNIKNDLIVTAGYLG